MGAWATAGCRQTACPAPPSDQIAEPVLFDHPLDSLPINTGFPSSSPHVTIVSLEEFDQETPLERRDRRLLRMFEGACFSRARIVDHHLA